MDMTDMEGKHESKLYPAGDSHMWVGSLSFDTTCSYSRFGVDYIYDWTGYPVEDVLLFLTPFASTAWGATAATRPAREAICTF